MTRKELIRTYRKGRRDFIGVDLAGANLKKVDLKGVNLKGANLEGANIGRSSWPLSCGSKGAKVDKKIFCQLVAHLCVVDIDNKKYKEIQKNLLSIAKQSHVWKFLK